MIFNEDKWRQANEMNSVLPVSTGLSWVRMAPSLAHAQEDYLEALLGSTMVTVIESIYAADPSERSANDSRLLRLAQRAVANLALWADFDALSVRISDQGFQRQQSDTWTPAYKYQEESMKRNFQNRGLNALDEMLVLLESNPDEYPDFAGSPACTRSLTSLVRDTAEVQEIYDIHSSRLIFMRLRPVMAQVEELVLQPLTGDMLYQHLRSWLATAPTDRTCKMEALRTRCRKVVVMAAIAQLIRTTGSVTDRGVFLKQMTGSTGGNDQPVPVANDRLQLMVADAQRALDGYAQRLSVWVHQEMSEYTTLAPSRVLDRDNDKGRAFWT